MPGDYEQALMQSRTWARWRARPAGDAADSAGAAAAGPGRRAGAAGRSVPLLAADLAGLATAAIVSGVDRGAERSLLCALYLAVVLAILATGGRHRLRICLRVSDEAGRIVTAAVMPVLLLLAWLPVHPVLRLALWSGGLLIACRGALYAALRAAHRRGLLTDPAIVVGAGTFGAYIADLMREHPEFGLRPVGLLDEGPPRLDLSLPTLGRPADLADVAGRLGVRRVIVSFSSACRDEDLVAALRASRPPGADVYLVPRFYELGMAVPRGCLDESWGVPLIPLRSSVPSPAALIAKRVIDIAVSAVLLAATAPAVVTLAAAVRLRSGQTALFRQARVTGRGRVVPVIKLRTLTAHDDHDTRWTSAEHCSPLGRRLRETHLDELPQLVNVMRGEMSLVGPRPERPYFAERFGREIPRYGDRNRMPAGVTGWAQVNGLNGDTSIFERARFDNYYVEYWSVWLDVVILARTLLVMARGLRRLRS